MSRFLKTLKNKPFSLIMSLPRNDIELAHMAEEAGADAIKIHINVEHRASGTYFGPFIEEKNTIKSILKTAKVPVGIVPGAEKIATKDEMMELLDMGIDFFDIYIENIPAFMLELPETLGRMYAPGYTTDLKVLQFLENWGMDMLEASVMATEHYGRELRLSHLLLYQWICKNSKSPVIIPTQLAIKPEEIKYLKKAGVSCIMIGAIVTGKEAETIYKAVKKFRKAIDEL
ncbi:MAG TPA: hypothetical protein PL110_16855 [Candidatus Eremiobacteraeota bacterium]|nr:MAG: hypothetical protein BWY64_01910 [bacterium ADurb.Bin363]HPZ09771.1 hypothetical protein [Candidatus Eremiobacteraeota bacterium]